MPYSDEDERIKRVEEILSAYNIEMKVTGCGCCGSPSVTFIHKGNVILNDEDNVIIDTIKDEKLK